MGLWPTFHSHLYLNVRKPHDYARLWYLVFVCDYQDLKHSLRSREPSGLTVASRISKGRWFKYLSHTQYKKTRRVAGILLVAGTGCESAILSVLN